MQQFITCKHFKGVKMQYKLITGPDDSTFCARITEFLNNGWKLHGNPTMTYDGKTVIAGQAIIKEDAEKNEECCLK